MAYNPREFETGLPSIRSRGNGLLDTTATRSSRIQTVDDSVLYMTPRDRANNVRFASSAGGYSLHSRTDSPVFYPRPPSPTNNGNRTNLLELQDQVKMFRDELTKRDKLIQQLTSMETKSTKISSAARSTQNCGCKIKVCCCDDEMKVGEDFTAERSSFQLRIESLTSQLLETRTLLEEREERLKKVMIEMEMARQNEEKHKSLAESFQLKLVELEHRLSSKDSRSDVHVQTLQTQLSESSQRIVELESRLSMEKAKVEKKKIEDSLMASRSEMTVQTLQSQLNEANERILELESRFRSHVEERETIRSQMSSWEQKYMTMTSKLSNYFTLEGVTDPETIIVKVGDLTQENASLRAKIYSMKEYVNNAEVETKACRETIMRLVTEAEKEQKSATKYSLELDSLRLERDNAMAKQREFEGEISMLRERQETTQRAMFATRKELEEKEARYATFETEVRTSSVAARSLELQIKGFREQMASLLSIEGHMPIQATDEAIRDRVKAVVMALRDKSTQIEVLESKVTNFTEQLDRQYELNKSADSRAKRVEGDFFGLQAQVRHLEEELAAADALRDGLRMDKDKYLRFLEKLAVILNVQSISVDVGFDMAVDTLMARAEQLSRNENDTLQERKSTILTLQRKIKATKEQLESRDLHIDLLRKKVTSMEERLAGKSDLDRERDGEIQRNKKLMKLNEKYKQELHDCRMELNDLKARMLEGSNFKSRTIEQEREIQNLELRLSEMDELRTKQSKKISTLKDTLEMRSAEVSTKHESVNNTIQALSSELRTTKSALDELTQKERQLLDLRQVIARMLGLDINSLAVPDYEIIARLEKLILAHTSGGVATATVSAITDGMGDGFRAGYEGAQRVFQVQRSRSPSRRVTTIKNVTSRSRSMSPTKKRDNRTY